MASSTPDDGPDGPAPRPAPGRRPLRSATAALLIVLAALLTPLAVLAAWTKAEITDTDRYVATMAPLADDPAVQAAVTNRVTEAVVQRLPVDSLVSDLAPGGAPLLDALLQRLGSALDSGVTGLVHDGVQRLVSSDAFPAVWDELNRSAHAAVDRAVTGAGGGAVEIRGGTVTLDLAPVIDRAKQALAADGVAIASRIPEIHTSYVLVRSEQVERVRTLLRLLSLAGYWVAVLAAACAAGGVLLAVRRRRAAVAAALAVAGAAGLFGFGLTGFRAVYLDRLPAGVDQDAAAAVYDTLVRYLRDAVRLVVVLGVLVALGAWLSGRGRSAGAVRGLWEAGLGGVRTAAERMGLRLGPVGRFVHRFKAWLCWAAVGASVLVLLLWDRPTALVAVWLDVALLAVLAVVELLDEPGTAPAGRMWEVRP
ncbi:hypothetical protein BX265_3789 [Streptomyces sp. TLI_235]|nr:hypothetical protein [Streptomyces sp. TLI_235]PBC78996.1 hypothetical protein BX265_3789 [Streptomyces sp. TLI_235]